MDVRLFKSQLDQIGLQLTDEQIEAFAAFEEALYLANETMNLTRVPREECGLRHFIDSLLFHDLVGDAKTVLDVGSGPGLPAWPIACAFPDLQLVALDAGAKTVAFMEANPLPNLTPVQGRAEEWDVVGVYDLVTGRALAPLSIQLEVSGRPCRLDGRVIPMRTPADLPEIERLSREMGLELIGIETRRLPGTDTDRVYPIYRKVKRSPAMRTWAEIKKKPR